MYGQIIKNKKVLPMNNVRTKNNKTERVEVRCTKAFKEALLEISVHNNITVSQLIESICTDKINEYFNKKSLALSFDKPCGEAKIKNTSRADYEREIWRMLEEGKTPTDTANWLNENGYKPQRGDSFSMNSVHSIRSRLKRERGR